MPVIDDIRENNKKMKGKGIKAQFGYFWEYYKIPTIIIICAGLALFSLIRTWINAKDTAFEAIIINAAAAPSEVEFADYAGIDLDEYDVIFDAGYSISADLNSYDQASYVNTQKIMAVVSSSSADVFFGDPEVIKHYMSADFFADLRDYLTEDELASYEAQGKVYWHQPVDEETGAPVGDSFPVAINIGDSPRLTSVPCFYTKDVYLTIVINNTHPETINKFLQWIK